MVLNLPPANAVTVWSLLSADEKISLARTLAETFQNGDYDHKVSGDHLDASGPLLGLNRALMRFIDIRFGEGIDTAGEVLELAEKLKILEKSGSSYSYEGNVIGRGKEATRLFLKTDEAMLKEIIEKISDSYKPQEFTPNEKVLEESML
jgi:hypothetical protein